MILAEGLRTNPHFDGFEFWFFGTIGRILENLSGPLAEVKEKVRFCRWELEVARCRCGFRVLSSLNMGAERFVPHALRYGAEVFVSAPSVIRAPVFCQGRLR